MLPKVTIGLDVGDRHTTLCVLDERGDVIERSQIPTRLSALERRFATLPSARVVLETGKHAPWMERALSGWKHETIVANARRLHLISRNHQKTDASDAELLARLGRSDTQLLKPVEGRAEATQADLALLRARASLVRGRTQQINHVRGVIASFGGGVVKCAAESFPRHARATLPEALAPALTPLLEQIELLTRQIRGLDKEIERICEARYPQVQRLRQVAGVGPITALCYVLLLEDPKRFPSSRSVGAYLGLVPRQASSGEREPELRISKCGDRMLRALLVQSAQYILGPFGPPSDLRHYGERIAARGGKAAKRRAVVAVARKLSSLLWVLWTTGATYEPLRQSAARPSGSGSAA